MLSGTRTNGKGGNTISSSGNQHGNGLESSPPANHCPSYGNPRTGGTQSHTYLGECCLLSRSSMADQTQTHCFNQDRCMAAQLGKPITILEEPSLLSHMEFLKRSRYAMPYDMFGSTYTALLRVVSGFRQVWANTRSEDSSVSRVDIRALAFQTDTEILCCQNDAVAGFESSGNAGGWSL